jgi:hypothetical protein
MEQPPQVPKWGQRAGREHAHQFADFVAGSLALDRVLDLLARQRALDEDGLAVDMGDATAFVVERFDGGDGHGRLRVKVGHFSGLCAPDQG